MIDTLTTSATRAYLALLAGIATLVATTGTMVRPQPAAFRLTPARTARGATFIEYAILAAIAVVIGAIILGAMTGIFTNVFTNLKSKFST